MQPGSRHSYGNLMKLCRARTVCNPMSDPYLYDVSSHLEHINAKELSCSKANITKSQRNSSKIHSDL